MTAFIGSLKSNSLMRSPLGNLLPARSSRRYLHRLLGCRNTRRSSRHSWRICARICIRCLERSAASNASSVWIGISNLGRSGCRVFGSDGRSGLATRPSRNRGLAHIHYSGCKFSPGVAVPSQLSSADCRCSFERLAYAVIVAKSPFHSSAFGRGLMRWSAAE